LLNHQASFSFSHVWTSIASEGRNVFSYPKLWRSFYTTHPHSPLKRHDES
jgi:hypothetical protein